MNVFDLGIIDVVIGLIPYYDRVVENKDINI